jgi:hypothetical protein
MFASRVTGKVPRSLNIFRGCFHCSVDCTASSLVLIDIANVESAATGLPDFGAPGGGSAELLVNCSAVSAVPREWIQSERYLQCRGEFARQGAGALVRSPPYLPYIGRVLGYRACSDHWPVGCVKVCKWVVHSLRLLLTTQLVSRANRALQVSGAFLEPLWDSESACCATSSADVTLTWPTSCQSLSDAACIGGEATVAAPPWLPHH